MNRQTRLLALSMVALAAFAPLTRAADGDARVFLRPTAVKILERPTKIAVWRIHGDAAQEKVPAVTNVDLALAKDLAAILLDDKTYSFDSAKKCEFQAGVGIRVWRDEQSVDIILCFHCHELQIVSPDPRSEKFPSITEDFDNARPAMVKLVKQAFPDDKEIQAMK